MEATFDSVAREFDEMPAKVVSRGRGMMASELDGAVPQAQQRALALWSTYGRGMAGSAGTFSARMSRNRDELVGYMFVEQRGGFFQEVGTRFHPPQPVLAPTVETTSGQVSELLARIGAEL